MDSETDKTDRPKRKITLEALVTARQKRRKDNLQGLRESALQISPEGVFNQMETLLQDSVSQFSRPT